MWIALAILGYGLLTAVTVLDKMIVSKKAVSPLAYTFYSSSFLIFLFFLFPFGVEHPQGFYWLVTFLAGGTFTLGLLTTFIAFQRSEVSHAGPLVGASIPIFILVLNFFSLGESFSQGELIGIALLIFGCFIISFEKSKEHNGWHTGFLWAILSAFLFAVSHIASKYAYNEYGFYSGLVWTRFMIGLTGLFVLFSYSARKEIFTGKKQKTDKKTNLGKWLLIIIDKVLSVVGTVLVQYAIAIGSVVIVNALLGVQYALLIIVVALLSRFLPKFFNEEYTGQEIIQEAIAVGFIASGLVFLL